jgi:acetyl-CoA C-acetyltransferase
MEDVVIVAAGRTAVGKFGGRSPKFPPPSSARMSSASCWRIGIDPAAVSEVIMGQVLTAGAGQNPARQAVIKAACPTWCRPTPWARSAAAA